MNRVNYEESIILAHASALYEQAKKIVIEETIKYAFIGAISFLAITLMSLQTYEPNEWVLTASFIFGGVFFGYFGWQTGRLKAFNFKFEAQRALCLSQIEKHLRKEA
jgi:hypothetical protein